MELEARELVEDEGRLAVQGLALHAGPVVEFGGVAEREALQEVAAHRPGGGLERGQEGADLCLPRLAAIARAREIRPGARPGRRAELLHIQLEGQGEIERDRLARGDEVRR